MFGGVLGLETLCRETKLIHGEKWPDADGLHCIVYLHCIAQFLRMLPAECREAKRVQEEGSNMGYAVSLLHDAQVYYEAAADLEPDSTSLQVWGHTVQCAVSGCVDTLLANL